MIIHRQNDKTMIILRTGIYTFVRPALISMCENLVSIPKNYTLDSKLKCVMGYLVGKPNVTFQSRGKVANN